MFDFMKKKKEDDPVQPRLSEPVKKPAIVNPDDFFADLERKPKERAAKKITADVAPPEVTGLREEPLSAAPDALSGINTEAIDTGCLKEENPYIDSNAVYGDIDEIDSSAIDTSSLNS